jgi:hypothetical protein
MDQVVVKNSRLRYVFLLLIAIGFVVAGIFIVLGANGAGDALLGWVTIIFFGAGIPLFAWQLYDSRPRLIIDEQGILDRTLGVGRIPWSEITSAHVQSISGDDFICLELEHPEQYAAKLSPVRRAALSANRALGCTDFIINLSGVNASTDEIFDLIMKRCELRHRGLAP